MAVRLRIYTPNKQLILLIISVMYGPPSSLSPGYVGAGMLSAAVAGGVFASPPPASILAAILCLHNAGTLGFCFSSFILK